MNKRSVLLLVLAVGLLGAAGIVLHRALGTRGAGLLAPKASHPARFAWARGMAYRYAIEARSESTSTLEGIQIGGAEGAKSEVDLAGELTLRCLGATPEDPEVALFAASLGTLARHRVRVFGREALGDEKAARATFDGHEAFVAIDPRGVLRATWFAPDAPAMFRYVMADVIDRIAVTLPEDATAAAWTAEEPGPSGRATASYVAGPKGELARTREGYATLLALPADALAKTAQDLEARGAIAIADGGYVQSIRDDERLTVRSLATGKEELASHAMVSLAFLDAARFDANAVAADLAKLDRHRPGDVMEATGEVQKKLLTGFAGSMTREELLAGVVSAMGLSRPQEGLVTQGKALLRLHPELASDLESLFEAPGTSFSGRSLILDLLASAGTPEAQAAMRAALASPSARADHRYGALLQRFSFVGEPTPESASFVEHAYDAARGDRDDRLAAAYSMGSVASHLAATGKREHAAIAERETARLARDLREAKRPEDKKALLAALGNAGSHAYVAEVAKYKDDPDEAVRRTAALALRKDPSPESRAALLGMLEDDDAQVAAASLDALGYQTVSRYSVAKIASAITAGKTAPEADPSMVTFLSKHLEDGATAQAALQYMLDRVPRGDYEEAQRIRNVLQQLPGAKNR